MVESIEYVNSESFEDIRTLKSMYDMDSIAITDMFGNRYRLHMEEIHKILLNKKITFELDKPNQDKRRKHTYLIFTEND